MSYETADHADNPVPDEAAPAMSADEQREIEEERARRLDPANRPEGSEVNNSDAELPTVKRFAEMNAEGEGSIGTADPTRAFREMEVSEEEQQAMAEERERRLDPANRPEGAEVDNTGRKMEDGRFVD